LFAYCLQFGATKYRKKIGAGAVCRPKSLLISILVATMAATANNRLTKCMFEAKNNASSCQN